MVREIADSLLIETVNNNLCSNAKIAPSVTVLTYLELLIILIKNSIFFFFKAVGHLSSVVFTAFEKRFSETAKTNCTLYLTTKVFYYTNLDLRTLFGLPIDLSSIIHLVYRHSLLLLSKQPSVLPSIIFSSNSSAILSTNSWFIFGKRYI